MDRSRARFRIRPKKSGNGWRRPRTTREWWWRREGMSMKKGGGGGAVLKGAEGVVAPYFNSDIGMLWAIESNREIIGASPSEGFTAFSFTDLGNGVGFGRPLPRLSPDQFRSELETYNVGSLIAWSAEAKEYLDR